MIVDTQGQIDPMTFGEGPPESVRGVDIARDESRRFRCAELAPGLAVGLVVRLVRRQVLLDVGQVVRADHPQQCVEQTVAPVACGGIGERQNDMGVLRHAVQQFPCVVIGTPVRQIGARDGPRHLIGILLAEDIVRESDAVPRGVVPLAVRFHHPEPVAPQRLAGIEHP